MKIVLVNPYLKLNDPPLGLAYMSAYLKERNIDCTIIDKEKNIVKAVKREKPDIVGVSAMLMDYDKVIEMAKAIKQLGVRVIVGGVQITTMPKSLSVFNAGVMGEGEETMLEMASGQDLKKTKGIVYRENGGIVVNEPRPLINPLDKIPIPDRDALPMKIYLKIRKGSFNKFGRYAGMFTSRGCPYRCVFCSSSSFWKGIRLHSPDRVVEEVRLLIDDYKVDGIIIWDDLFAVSSKRLKLIVEKLKEEKVDIPFQGFARANLINREVCKLLKKMNVTNIAFGLESGSEKILTYLKKGQVTVEENRKALELCKKFGIRTNGSLIIGSPDETEEDLKQTLNLLNDKNLDVAHVCQLTPYPGTEIWEYAKKMGIVSDDPNFDLKKIYLL